LTIFDPLVERWRSLVEAEVPPQYVDKVLWIIQGESGGNPIAIGDSGVAIGLLQIQDGSRWAGRPTKEQLLDPTFNIRWAVQNLGIGQGRFTDWGEGTNGTPTQFGALGNYPYPDSGSGGGNTAVLVDFPIVGGIFDSAGNAIAKVPGLKYLTDGAGKVFDAAGNFIGWTADHIPGGGVAKDILGTSTEAFNVLRKTSQGLTWLLNPQHWVKMFVVGSGVALIGAGAFIFVKGEESKGFKLSDINPDSGGDTPATAGDGSKIPSRNAAGRGAVGSRASHPTKATGKSIPVIDDVAAAA